jgi:4,5:9,10-diseco-3-hydroxy-5,9,17-trioxoandrosta-1(10),2-diene-4-oate hydrolase
MYPAYDAAVTARRIALPTGVTLRIATAGPRDGVPAVLLPGWGASVYMYRHAFTHLPRYGMRVTAVDLRGFGLSDKPTRRGAYTLAEYRQDVAALLDVLGLARPVLIGQSMGGGLALRFALRQPERIRGLVLINPTGLVPLRFIPLLRLVPPEAMHVLGRRAVPRALVEFILRHVAYGDASRVTEQDVDEYWAPSQLPGYVFAATASLAEFDWSPVSDHVARALRVRTTVLLGTRDRLVHNDVRAVRRLAGATVHELAGGHCVHEEQPELAYRVIGEFVAARDDAP